jgi:hypothetical protein
MYLTDAAWCPFNRRGSVSSHPVGVRSAGSTPHVLYFAALTPGGSSPEWKLGQYEKRKRGQLSPPLSFLFLFPCPLLPYHTLLIQANTSQHE